MAISEIEKLERRYAENPKGLTFAPLAEALRKKGDLDRALDILKPGLEINPDYIPASIVLGRCHLDRQSLDDAESAFNHVLALDGENVIALKALADIAERQSRYDQAERWLHTLLSVDRSNDEARQHLARIEGARQAAPKPEPQETVVESPNEAPPMGSAAAGTELVVDDLVPDEARAEEPDTRTDTDRGLAWVSDGSGGDDVEPLVLEELDGARVEPVDGLTDAGMMDYEHAESGRQPDVELEPELHEMTSTPSDLDVERSEELVLQGSATNEFQTPDASLELADDGPRSDAGAPPAEPATAVEAATPTAEAVDDTSGPIVTETLAEILLAQGHRAEALEMYRELDRRSGGSDRFRHKISELTETAAEPEPDPEPAPQVEEERQAAPLPAVSEVAPPVHRVAYAAAETGGQTVTELFAAILAARLPGAPSPAPAGESHDPPPSDPSALPTRPASDALSLSAVFGEESPATPPAVPTGAAASAAGAVSYDEFFGAPAAPSKPRAPDPKADDLDQFHAWLQNLKR